MKLCIRAHDLGVTGTENILRRLDELGLDGVQMVCYKAYDDIPYLPGAITAEKAEEIGKAFRDAGKIIPLVGAYFNPVHSDRKKALRCENIFGEYLRVCRLLGCDFVGSETGSFNDDSWTYHPRNRTEEAVDMVKYRKDKMPVLQLGWVEEAVDIIALVAELIIREDLEEDLVLLKITN